MPTSDPGISNWYPLSYFSCCSCILIILTPPLTIWYLCKLEVDSQNPCSSNRQTSNRHLWKVSPNTRLMVCLWYTAVHGFPNQATSCNGEVLAGEFKICWHSVINNGWYLQQCLGFLFGSDYWEWACDATSNDGKCRRLQCKWKWEQAVEEAWHVQPTWVQTECDLQWSQPILQSHLERITSMCSLSTMLSRTTRSFFTSTVKVGLLISNKMSASKFEAPAIHHVNRIPRQLKIPPKFETKLNSLGWVPTQEMCGSHLMTVEWDH